MIQLDGMIFFAHLLISDMYTTCIFTARQDNLESQPHLFLCPRQQMLIRTGTKPTKNMED